VIADSAFGSTAWLIAVLVLVFLGVYLVATMFVGTRARARRQASLAARIGPGASGEEGDASDYSAWLPPSLASAGQRFAVATGFSASLDERLEAAGVRVLAGEFVAMIALAAVAGAVVSGLLLPNVVFVVMIAAVAGLIPWVWLVWSRTKRQNMLVDQLADTLSILASSLRAGYSFLQALDTVSKEIGEPSASEFQRVVAEIRLGRPIDDALTAMADRVGSPDLKWAVIAVNVQREVGGNLAEVLDIVANTVRERAYIRRQVRVLSAEGRISVGILAALPFVIMLYLAIVRPDYISLLFTTTIGVILLIVGASLMAFGVWVMTRIVRIDV
jgi:tight adherence protein B